MPTEEGNDNMSYRDLVTVSVDLDTSALQERLEEIGLSEDSVREIVQEILSDEGLRDLSGTYVEQSGLDDAVQSALENTDFEGRIATLESLNTCGVDLNDLADIPQRVDTLERNAENIDTDALDNLTQRVDSLESAWNESDVPSLEAFKLLQARVAELETTLASRPAVQGMTLFELLTQAARILGIARG